MQIRDEINLRIGSILGLESNGVEAREELIREANQSESFFEFLREWLLVRELKKDQIFVIKVWMGLNYAELAGIFDIPIKEITQIIRMARSSQLPPYRVSETEAYEQSDWSCFLVDQHLSPWIDGEIETASHVERMLKHFDGCDWCRKRRAQYRDLQMHILAQRPVILPISLDEWQITLRKWRLQRRRLKMRIALIGILSFILGGLAMGIFTSRPEKIPNVYEIPENL